MSNEEIRNELVADALRDIVSAVAEIGQALSIHLPIASLDAAVGDLQSASTKIDSIARLP